MCSFLSSCLIRTFAISPQIVQVNGYTVEVALQWCSDAFRCGRATRLLGAPGALGLLAMLHLSRSQGNTLSVQATSVACISGSAGSTLLAAALRLAPHLHTTSRLPHLLRSDTIIGFVNSIKTVDGGTHIDGAKAALTRTGGRACSVGLLGLVQAASLQACAQVSSLRAEGSLLSRCRQPAQSERRGTLQPLNASLLPMPCVCSEQPGPQAQSAEGG